MIPLQNNETRQISWFFMMQKRIQMNKMQEMMRKFKLKKTVEIQIILNPLKNSMWLIRNLDVKLNEHIINSSCTIWFILEVKNKVQYAKINPSIDKSEF